MARGVVVAREITVGRGGCRGRVSVVMVVAKRVTRVVVDFLSSATTTPPLLILLPTLAPCLSLYTASGKG
jgi:hypothetical protein